MTMQPQPWIIEEFNRREREKRDAQWAPIPLQAPRWDGVVDHPDVSDDGEDRDERRSSVIIIDMNDLGVLEEAL
jgi:hypothetical protein